MRKVVLLRGVAPKGQNRIPSMSALANMLEALGFKDVKTYIQSGNIVLTSDLSDEEIRIKVHDCILNNIGADLSVIVKDTKQLSRAIAENPFYKGYDSSMCHIVFTNDPISEQKLQKNACYRFWG